MNFWQKMIGDDPSRKRDFPGHQPGEEVELMTVLHWMSLAPYFLQVTVVFLLALLFVSSDFYSDFFEMPRTHFLTIVVSLFLHVICFRFYNYFLRIILVTSFRVIDVRHSVFLKRGREAIPMSNIQDFRYLQKGILQRFFHYGTLMILGASTDLKYVFRYIPKVNKMHHILGEVHQKALRNTLQKPITSALQSPLPED